MTIRHERLQTFFPGEGAVRGKNNIWLQNTKNDVILKKYYTHVIIS